MDKSFCAQSRASIEKKSVIPPLVFNCLYASSVIKKNAESTDKLRNLLTFADSAYKFFANSTYNCGFLLHSTESTYSCGIQNISYICLLRNPQQNKCAGKIYVTGIFMRNPLESTNTQTQNCAPIQCTVWPRNVLSIAFLPVE